MGKKSDDEYDSPIFAGPGVNCKRKPQCEFDAAGDDLRQWLDQNQQWDGSGEARYLGYNSPFVPSFLRYGEVQIPIRSRS